MTVNVETPYASATVTEGVTDYSFDFTIQDETELVVQDTVSEQQPVTLVLNSDYSVTLNGSGPNPGWGFITLLIAQPIGSLLEQGRNMPFDQDIEWANYGDLPMDLIERSFDKTALIDQQLQDEANRALKAPPGSTGDFVLPPAEANAIVAMWNSTEDGLLIGPTANEISSAQGYAETCEAIAAAFSATFKFLSSYSSLADAVTQIGATPATLIVDQDDVMASPITTPETLQLYFNRPGVLINTNGNLLTVHSPFHVIATSAQNIFSTGASVNFVSKGRVPLNWFGTDGAAFSAACSAGKSSASKLLLANSSYTINAGDLTATDAIAIESLVGRSTLNFTGDVKLSIYDGFSLKNLNLTTTHTYANTIASFYYLFEASEIINNCELENVSYKQTTIIDGSERGNSFLNLEFGVAGLSVRNVNLEGIRRGIVVGTSGAGVGVPMAKDVSINGLYGRNMQTVFAPGSPADGVAYQWLSKNIVVNDISLINTATQKGNFSGGARTGHSAIIGSMGIGGKITKLHVENVIEHSVYLYCRELVVSGVTLIDAEDFKIVGLTKTNTSDASINVVVHRITEDQAVQSAAIFTAYYVDGLKISDVDFLGTNNDDGSGNAERSRSVLALSRSGKNIHISDIKGQYLIAGVLSYLTNETWEEEFENITIENCNILDPVTPTTATYYAAANKYLTYYPDNAGAHATWSAGDPLVKNLIVRNNYFAQTNDTLGGADTLTPISKGRGGTKLLGLIKAQDMEEVRLSGNDVDGWYGGSSGFEPIDVDTAASGNKGYCKKIYINETFTFGTNNIMPSRIVNMPSMSEGSRYELLGKSQTESSIEYLGGRIVFEKGSSISLTPGEVESLFTQSSMSGNVTLNLGNTEFITTALYLPLISGYFEMTTNTGDYLLAQVSTTTVVSVNKSVNANIIDNPGDICAFPSGNYLNIKNNTGGTVIVTFRFRMAYHS